MTDDFELRIAALKSVRECQTFANNAERLGRSDLAGAARLREVHIKAAQHGAKSDVELECIKAILAYESARTRINGKTTRASRTWQMLARHGVIAAVERVVTRDSETLGYDTLVEMGLAEYAFEAVILRNPEHFSSEAVARSKSRLRNE